MSKKVAVMQPYFFPYLGYFNLVSASDIFVFYDDVNYIKKGWINKNNILINGNPKKISVPLSEASQNKIIKDIEILNFSVFKKDFLKKIFFSYKKAKNFDFGFFYVEKVLSSEFNNISDLACNSVKTIFDILEISKTFYLSSQDFSNTKGLEKAKRLIEITKSLDSNKYINSLGGQELYSKDFFISQGVNLEFCQPIKKEYKQYSGNVFNENLSIIDLTMNVDKNDLPLFFESYKLI